MGIAGFGASPKYSGVEKDLAVLLGLDSGDEHLISKAGIKWKTSMWFSKNKN
jgi:hypothetical protein